MSAARKPKLPPGWRPEWRPPKEKPAAAPRQPTDEERAQARARAKAEADRQLGERVRQWLNGPLPPPAERRDEMLAVLMAIARTELVEPKDRIAAARAVIDADRKSAPDGDGDEPSDLTDAELARRRRAALEELAKAAPEAANDDDGKGKEPTR